MMSLSARRELIASTALRYQKSGKTEKGRILNEFTAASGYNRKYAIVLLLREVSAVKSLTRPPRHRRATYGADVKHALTDLWKLSDGLCGKLLAAALPALMDRLKVFHELEFCPEVERKLRTISPATIDRLLKKVRREGSRGIGTTRPGLLLKHQIAIRTFADWDDPKPGFAEIDLVAHCAEDASGEFAYTLTFTDIETGWVELFALKNRSQMTVTAGLDRIGNRLPFPILGLDCDNGSEFINHNLKRFCDERQITFTRCRPYRKNDQCYVEQKNGAVVRRLAGYARYEGEDAAAALNRLYSVHRMYFNFFQPCRKLVGKTREGAKVKKKYDDPQTPYQRLLNAGTLSGKQEEELKTYYESINPAHIRRRIETLGQELSKHAVRRNAHVPSAAEDAISV